MSDDPDAKYQALYEQLHILGQRSVIHEQPFTSHKRVVGRFIVMIREAWNSVATKWYVRPMVHQQKLFNEAAIDLLYQLIDLHRRIDQLELLEQRLIGTDRDVTSVARKVAEGEYRLRQYNRVAAEEHAELAQLLSRVESAATPGLDTDES